MTQTINKATALQTQILCLNSLYAHSKEIIEYEINAISQYIGKCPFKQDGSFKAKHPHSYLDSKKYKVNVYGFDFWVDTHYYHTVSYGNYEIKVRTTVSGGGYDKNGVNCNHCQFTQSFNLFTIDKEYNITGLSNDKRDFLNNIFDESVILKDAEEVKKAAEIYESKLSKVPYLFRSALYLGRITSN